MKRARLALALCILLVPLSEAHAALRIDGAAPSRDPLVSLTVKAMPQGEALRKLSQSAGWSLVLQGTFDQPVDIAAQQVKATQLLEALLEGGTYVAKWNGPVLVLRRDDPTTATPDAVDTAPIPITTPSSQSAPADAGAPPIPLRIPKGGHQVVAGHHFHLSADESVQNLTVVGGEADIEGTVTGDLTIVQGVTRLRSHARVEGNARVLGGTLQMDPDAQVLGSITEIGGTVERVSPGTPSPSGVQKDVDLDAPPGATGKEKGLLTRSRRPLSVLALLLGALLFQTFMPRRLLRIQQCVRRRPLATFLGGLGGVAGTVGLFLALIVSLVGIPLAFLLVPAVGLGLSVGATAVTTAWGERLARHKTDNRYGHLLAGATGIVLLTFLPWVGSFVVPVVGLWGLGAVLLGWRESKERRDGMADLG